MRIQPLSDETLISADCPVQKLTGNPPTKELWMTSRVEQEKVDVDASPSGLGLHTRKTLNVGLTDFSITFIPLSSRQTPCRYDLTFPNAVNLENISTTARWRTYEATFWEGAKCFLCWHILCHLKRWFPLSKTSIPHHTHARQRPSRRRRSKLCPSSPWLPNGYSQIFYYICLAIQA